MDIGIFGLWGINVPGRTFGGFETVKGQIMLIEALNILNSKYKETLAVRIVGDVFENDYEVKSRIIKKINSFNLSSMVDFSLLWKIQ